MKKLTVENVVCVKMCVLVVLRKIQELIRNGLCAVEEGGYMIVLWILMISMLMDTSKSCALCANH